MDLKKDREELVKQARKARALAQEYTITGYKIIGALEYIATKEKEAEEVKDEG